jgi:hypothetical protein
MTVDLIHNVLRIADREWRVALDLSTGGLKLDLSTGVYFLKPLTWGDKRRLARFANLGEEFLRRNMTLACATPAVWPDDEVEAEALVLAAATVTSPGYDALPLSIGTLLRISAEISRAMGMAIDELDHQAAVDVEALWRLIEADSRRTRQAEHLEVSAATLGDVRRSLDEPLEPGWNRILVVSDPIATAPEASASTGEEETPPAEPAESTPGEGATGFAARQAEHESQPASATAPLRSDSAPLADSTFSQADRSPRSFSHAENRFRVTWSGGPKSAPPASQSAFAVAPTAGNNAPLDTDSSLIRPSTPIAQRVEPLPLADRDDDAAVATYDRLETSPREEVATAPLVRDTVDFLFHEPLLPQHRDVSASEDLMETLADQLELAAAAAGIDIEE